MKDLLNKKCIPCEGGVDRLNEKQVSTYMKDISSDWQLVDSMKIVKNFTFTSYMECIDFVNKIAALAESEGHHPVLQVFFARVKVEFWTHAILGLSENDFIMAAKTDQLYY